MWNLVSRSGSNGKQTYDIKVGKTVLGRAQKCAIAVADDLVSRQHCQIEFIPETNSLILRDLSSKNGTFHNGKRILQPIPLGEKDQIRIGSTVFELQYVGVTRIDTQLRQQTVLLNSELVIQSIDRNIVLLNQISEKLNDISDLNSAIEHITSLSKAVLEAQKCSIVFAKDFDKLRKIGIPRTITRKAIEDHLIVLIQNPEEESRLGLTAILQEVYSALCVPILMGNRVSAIFYMDRTSSTSFTEADLNVAVAISHQVALAIQRKHLEGRLSNIALHDPLTGLPNQVSFIKYLNHCAEKAKQDPDAFFIVITLDLDNFRTINDSFGYIFGDEILRMLAQRLTTSLPKEYSVSRIDSDEFALLIWGQKKNERVAARIAEGLHQIISKAFCLQDRKVYLSAGVGISQSTSGFERPIDLLRDAQTAMHRAKEKGSSSTTLFDSQMRDRSIARLNLESTLDQAIENHEFFVKYQPVISLKESAICGFEALVRWRQSHTREISASNFIPLAEKTQQIFKIDRLVLHDACMQLTKWIKQYQVGQQLWVSVNVSSRHMANEGLTWNLQQIFEATGLEPARLNLEFTERMLMEESNQTIIILNQLKEMGVQLSIDDFGKGYTSLSYLRHFPFNYLKLDRSFIFENDWDMANLVIELAHKLNLKVIAEGVENQDQLAHMRTLNCDLAQGNYIAADLDAGEAGKMLIQGISPLLS